MVERRWRRAVVERRWMRAVVERRGQSPDACVQRMRATNQGLRYIRRHTTLACEESQLSVADDRERNSGQSKKRDRHP